MKHVVQFSTGLGSAEVARRAVEEYGKASVDLLTADTLVEDPDNWRFADEVVDYLDMRDRWTVLADGRTPMQVGRDHRVVPNNRMAVCSRVLKRDLLRAHIEANYTPVDTVIHLGFDWTEPNRFKASIEPWKPWTIDALLTRPPYTHKSRLMQEWRDRGVEPPRLYAQGFSHANCLHPDTQFITDEGIKTLRECLGKAVRVLGKGGGWKDATVESFGEQELLRVIMHRYGDTKTVLATPDHLWPIRKAAGRTDYVWRSTEQLASGARIAGMYGHVRHNVRPSAIGIAAGFTFGDGTADTPTSGQITPARAFLCGEKDRALLPYFATCRTSTRPGRVTVVHDLPRSWKSAPSLDESQSYLYGWMAGYFAADGSVAKGSAKISSSRRGNLEHVRDVCTRLGIATNPIRVTYRKGYGETDTPLYSLALVMASLRADFFIIPEHLARFESRPSSTPRPADWQVVDVERTGERGEVMCAVVPDGHVFTLADNALSHNCGGGCVRGGQAQWQLLLTVNRPRYLEWEAEEQKTRGLLDKDVSILRDRTDGTLTPLSLRGFRERIESQPSLFDADDWGACGCFMGEDT